ncbi:unnamed protein product [Amoebophrya sp. A120]|nr:unnamed protein product [Amoebophrya sp. A120]|eukprot:GSA120T00020938001.1
MDDTSRGHHEPHPKKHTVYACVRCITCAIWWRLLRFHASEFRALCCYLNEKRKRRCRNRRHLQGQHSLLRRGGNRHGHKRPLPCARPRHFVLERYITARNDHLRGPEAERTAKPTSREVSHDVDGDVARSSRSSIGKRTRRNTADAYIVDIFDRGAASCNYGEELHNCNSRCLFDEEQDFEKTRSEDEDLHRSTSCDQRHVLGGYVDDSGYEPFDFVDNLKHSQGRQQHDVDDKKFPMLQHDHTAAAASGGGGSSTTEKARHSRDVEHSNAFLADEDAQTALGGVISISQNDEDYFRPFYVVAERKEDVELDSSASVCSSSQEVLDKHFWPLLEDGGATGRPRGGSSSHINSSWLRHFYVPLQKGYDCGAISSCSSSSCTGTGTRSPCGLCVRCVLRESDQRLVDAQYCSSHSRTGVLTSCTTAAGGATTSASTFASGRSRSSKLVWKNEQGRSLPLPGEVHHNSAPSRPPAQAAELVSGYSQHSNLFRRFLNLFLSPPGGPCAPSSTSSYFPATREDEDPRHSTSRRDLLQCASRDRKNLNYEEKQLVGYYFPRSGPRDSTNYIYRLGVILAAGTSKDMPILRGRFQVFRSLVWLPLALIGWLKKVYVRHEVRVERCEVVVGGGRRTRQKRKKGSGKPQGSKSRSRCDRNESEQDHRNVEDDEDDPDRAFTDAWDQIVDEVSSTQSHLRRSCCAPATADNLQTRTVGKYHHTEIKCEWIWPVTPAAEEDGTSGARREWVLSTLKQSCSDLWCAVHRFLFPQSTILTGGDEDEEHHIEEDITGKNHPKLSASLHRALGKFAVRNSSAKAIFQHENDHLQATFDSNGTLKELDPTLDNRNMSSPADQTSIVFFLHGGAFVLCDHETHRYATITAVQMSSCVLFVPNYRRPPDVCMETTICDCLNAYFCLLEDYNICPKRVSFLGDSAGGALCLQVLLQLRDQGELYQKVLRARSSWSSSDVEQDVVNGTTSCSCGLLAKNAIHLSERTTSMHANHYTRSHSQRRLRSPSPPRGRGSYLSRSSTTSTSSRASTSSASTAAAQEEHELQPLQRASSTSEVPLLPNKNSSCSTSSTSSERSTRAPCSSTTTSRTTTTRSSDSSQVGGLYMMDSTTSESCSSTTSAGGNIKQVKFFTKASSNCEVVDERMEAGHGTTTGEKITERQTRLSSAPAYVPCCVPSPVSSLPSPAADDVRRLSMTSSTRIVTAGEELRRAQEESSSSTSGSSRRGVLGGGDNARNDNTRRPAGVVSPRPLGASAAGTRRWSPTTWSTTSTPQEEPEPQPEDHGMTSTSPGEDERDHEEQKGRVQVHTALLPKSVCLLSPWVDLSADWDTDRSAKVNRSLDLFRPETIKRFANAACTSFLTENEATALLRGKENSAGGAASTRTVDNNKMKSRERGSAVVDEKMNKFYPRKKFDLQHPVTSVTFAERGFHDLPPMLVMVGERELLRDQIVAFVQKLVQAPYSSGSRPKIRFEIYQDMCHVFPGFYGIHPTPDRAWQSVVDFLKRRN